MTRKTQFLGLCAVCAIATAVACSGTPQTPLSPGAVSNAETIAVNADGSTIKMTAPTLLSPIDGEVLSTRRPELRFSNPRGRFVPVGFAYDLEVRDENGNLIYSQTIGETPNVSQHVVPLELEYETNFTWRARGRLNDQVGPWSASNGAFRTPDRPRQQPGGGGGRPGGTLPRTPDPAPGTRLPLPNMYGVVAAVAAQYGAFLYNSCQEHGGTWDFMDTVLDTLRTFDDRWGYNWKRGNVGDPSLDVIDYHWGAGLSEGSIQVYIIDIIAGHCGATPSPWWNDVTDITYGNGGVGRWTGRGRFTN